MTGGRTPSPRALRRGEILVVDPRPLVAQGIATAFDPAVSRVLTIPPATVPDLAIAGGLAVVGMSQPDVADIIAALADRGRRVIVFGIDSAEDAVSAIDAGAVALVFDDVDAAGLRDVAEAVRRGEVVFPPGLLGRRIARRDGFDPFGLLTPREGAVLSGLLAGLRPLDIAERDFVSVVTVRNQVQSILTKLDVHSQLEAVAAARAVGWSAHAA